MTCLLEYVDYKSKTQENDKWFKKKIYKVRQINGIYIQQQQKKTIIVFILWYDAWK